MRIGEPGGHFFAVLGHVGLSAARWLAVASWLGAAAFAGASLDIPLEGQAPALAPRGATPAVPRSQDESPSHEDRESDLDSWEETPT